MKKVLLFASVLLTAGGMITAGIVSRSASRAALSLSRKGFNHTQVRNAGIDDAVALEPSETAPLAVPFSLAPTQEDVSAMTIVDVQNDGRTWSYETGEKALFYRYSTKLDADDYAIIPVAIDETGELYRFSVSARVQNGYFGESFELCAGSDATPDALTPVFQSGMIYNEEYKSFEGFFAVPEPGVHYVAVHVVSPKNCMRFYVQDIAVEKTEINRNVPAACGSVSAVAAEKGELKATVGFVVPSVLADGSDAGSEPLTVKVSTPVDVKTVSGVPGESITVEVATVHGDNEIDVVASNESGEGLHVAVSLFTGPDIPSEPVVKGMVSDDNMTLTLNFESGIVGKNGGYVNPAEVAYTLHTYDEDEGWVVLKELGTVAAYNYTLEDGTPQTVLNLGVTAHNGQGENKSVVTVADVVGTPYPLPADEIFEGRKFTYSPVVIEAPTDDYFAEYTIIDPADLLEGAENESCISMAGYITDYGATKGQIALPKFSTEGVENAVMGCNIYFHPLMPETTFRLHGVEMDSVVIGTVTPDMFDAPGWHTVKFDIPSSMLDRQWVVPTITSSYPGEDEEEYIIIDRYFLRSVVDHDLAVMSVTAPAKAEVGSRVNLSAIIENRGENDETCANVRWTLSANDVTIHTEPVAPFELKAGEKEKVELDYMPITDHIGEVVALLEIAGADDEMANNAKQATISVEKGEEPIVTDLTGVPGEVDGSVLLTWTPIGKLVGVQDCEKLTAFYYGKKLGEFVNVDGDGKNTYVLTGIRFPGQGYAKGFQVMNYPKSGITIRDMAPHSGDQYLIAFCPDDEETRADDWLISPAVMGGTEVSFWLNVVSDRFGAETVEVLSSATGVATDDFALVERFEKSTLGWEKISVTLPDDAKYFAIRYTSFDVFGIMIDDIDYIPASGLPVVTYNIYRDGELLMEGVNDAMYIDMNAGEGVAYNVSAVVDGEEKPLSNTFIVTTLSGLESIENNHGFTVEVSSDGLLTVKRESDAVVNIYGVDGRCVATMPAEETTLRLAPGIYIVNCDKESVKVKI